MSKWKAQIDPLVRAKLEEIGVDAVKSKLVWIMNVRTLAEQDKKENPLGDGVLASQREMQEWLSEKNFRAGLWIKVGVVAAILAAGLSFLAWRFPIN
jgi:hypothetical protein